MTGNKLRNIFFTPHILEQLFKFGSRDGVAVIQDAVPGDAQMRGAGYAETRGAFYLTFEHDSFKALATGELIPEMRPLFRDARAEVHIGPANDHQAQTRVIEDLIASCQRNGVWLSHEDGHGAFKFQKESTEEWLRQAVED